MKRSSAVFLLLASFIGAGFATGKELVVFYARFGLVGLVNVVLTTVILYIFINFYISMANCFCVNSIYQHKHYKIINVLLIICYFTVCSALFASVNEITQFLNVKKPLCAFVVEISTLILVFAISLNDVRGLLKVSSILVPIILLFYFVVCISAIIKGNFKINNYIYSKNILLSVGNSYNYVGINTILSLELFKKISINCNKSKSVAIGCSLIFGCLVFLGVYALMCSNAGVIFAEMPLLFIAASISKKIGWCYVVVMWFAIITSILTTVYTIKVRLNRYIKNNIILTMVSIIPCFIFSFVGFGNLVEYLYPIMGAVGVGYFILFKLKYSKNTKIYNV